MVLPLPTETTGILSVASPTVWDAFRILLFGIDTVYLSFDTEVSPAMYERLLAEKDQARQVRNERNAAYCSEWLDAQVYPTGTNSGFQVLIDKAGVWSIKLQKGNEQCPGVYVEMRSKALHTHPGGPLAATEDALAWIRAVLFADADDTTRAKIALGQEKLSRYDLHCDWQGGWEPSLTEAEARQFIRPARVKWQPYMDGDVCTGYTFGRKRIMARIYNKSIEARGRHDDEYFALIAQHAGETYNPDQDIWRLEFQLKREGVQGFCLAGKQEDYDDQSPEEQALAEMDGEDLPTIGTLTKAVKWTPQLWGYLTSRWLRLAEPNASPNKARWPVHPVWQQLQQGFTQAHSTPLTPAQCTLVREQRHSGRRRLITRLATAITTSAWLMVETDPTQAVREFLAQMEATAQQVVAYQEEKKAAGRQRLKDTVQEQYARNVEQLAHEAGGIFAITGVLKQDLPAVADMPDLLVSIAGDLDKLAQYKGGVPQMLYDKWCREYKVVPPRRLLRLPKAAQFHEENAS